MKLKFLEIFLYVRTGISLARKDLIKMKKVQDNSKGFKKVQIGSSVKYFSITIKTTNLNKLVVQKIVIF